MKSKSHEVEVKNFGPVPVLTFQTPHPGGVVVLEGGQGVGKSTVIRGVSRLLGGKASDLAALDGAPRGSIAIDEAILRVTRNQARATGELEVTGIESRLDIGAMVDPGYADPEVNDRERTKAIVSLSGVKAQPEMFHEVCGGADEYEALAVDDETDDLILLSARVKKALEAAARQEEARAEKARAEYQALRATFEDLDLDAPHDAAELSAAQEAAAANLASMRTHNEGAEIVRRAVEVSQRKLEELAAASENPEELLRKRGEQLDEAASWEARATSLAGRIAELQAEIDVVERKATAARANVVRANLQARDYEARAKAAEEQADRRAVLAQDAARTIPPLYTPEQLEAAEAAILEARAASDRGAVIRRAREQEAKAGELHAASKASAKRGELLRDRARSTDVVLSGAFPASCPLKYANGRLVLKTDRAERELYSDLSHGERWKVAIDFVAPIVKQDGKKGLLTLPQEAWEALDLDNQGRVIDLATTHEIVILTAQATRGPLTATILTGQTDNAAAGS